MQDRMQSIMQDGRYPLQRAYGLDDNTGLWMYWVDLAAKSRSCAPYQQRLQQGFVVGPGQ